MKTTSQTYIKNGNFTPFRSSSKKRIMTMSWMLSKLRSDWAKAPGDVGGRKLPMDPVPYRITIPSFGRLAGAPETLKTLTLDRFGGTPS